MKYIHNCIGESPWYRNLRAGKKQSRTQRTLVCSLMAVQDDYGIKHTTNIDLPLN